MDKFYKKIKSDGKSQYRINIERSLMLTLLLFIILIYISPRLDVKLEEKQLSNFIISVENIPVTHQLRRLPPPPKPTVPVPSEDESIPEDETIPETILNQDRLLDDLTEGLIGIAGNNVMPPRPIAWVFPEYPEDEKKKGVRGTVKLSIHINEKGNVIEVLVIENTTGSQKCAKAAIEAAYRSRFQPAREGNKAINFWIIQPYRFDLSK